MHGETIAVDPKRRKQVPNEMERLEKATEELMAIVEETESKLCDILADSKPKPDDESKKDELSVVSLPGDIRAIRYKITNQSNRLGNILARLEL